MMVNTSCLFLHPWTGIDQLLSENDKQRQELQELEYMASQECQRFQKYYEKMEDQRKIVVDMEKAFVTQHELQAQNQIVNDLELKSKDSLHFSSA